MMIPVTSLGGRPSRRRAFTLIELVVVMGIIIVLLGITVISVGAIARESNLASGKNKVKAALGEARALAVRSRRPVGVVFRAQWDPNQPDVEQQTEIMIVEYSGATINVSGLIVDRFVPSQSVAPQYLPAGIRVGGRLPNPIQIRLGDPASLWLSQPQLQRTNPNNPTEAHSAMFGVLFDKDGSLITQVPESDADEHWVDLDNERDNNGLWILNSGNTSGSTQDILRTYDEPGDEVAALWVAVLAVYDDDEAREVAGDQDWNDLATRDLELATYIEGLSDKLYFNRYTGVVMR